MKGKVAERVHLLREVLKGGRLYKKCEVAKAIGLRYDCFDSTLVEFSFAIPELFETDNGKLGLYMKLEKGDKIRIISMEGEPHYSGKEGFVTHIDSIGQVHGTWGGLALQLDKDQFEKIEVQNG